MKFFLLLLFSPFAAISQDISGLWTGYVSTTEKTLPYEVVISKKNGEWVGYSQISFVVNGKDITSVKKLKVEYDQRHIILEDEDLLKDNFDKEAAKKIVQTSELDLRQQGRQWMMEGSFKTKRTRVLRPAEGIIVLYKSPEPALANAKLEASLNELQLKDALVVFKPSPALANPIDVAVNAPVNLPVSDEEVAAQQAEAKAAMAKNEAAKASVKAPTKPAAPAVSQPKPATATVAKPVEVPKVSTEVAVKTNPVIPPVVKTPAPALPVLPSVNLASRKIENIETIPVYADSLVLSIYDNGEIDGDTVSVILNGRTIMGQKRLGSRAQSLTVYLTPELGDDLQLVMFAENLGTYPPNTGLLIIQDGTRRREVRFSGDLNKNAAISLKRQR